MLTIPFDPSLVLGNVVHPERIEALMALAGLQQPVEEAQRKLNALLLSKHKLDMTTQELLTLGIDPENEDFKSLAEAVNDLDGKIAKAALAFATASMEAETNIGEKLKEIGQTKVHKEIESPFDYNKSAIQAMPLSSDTMTFDAQYFRNQSNREKTSAHSNSVASYVHGQVYSLFGPDVAAKVSASVKDATESQHRRHELKGTLVITANCTHRQADVFAPFVLDPEKAIRAWNACDLEPKIDTDDEQSMKDALASDEGKMYLLSGATNGSSFVGLVHLVRTEATRSRQSASAASATIEATLSTGSFIASKSGEFGVDASFADQVKSLLSTSNLQAHASVITHGIIPSIKSRDVETVVHTLKPDPKQVMGQLAAIQGATDSEVNTLNSGAEKARDGKAFMELNNSYVGKVVSSVGDLDRSKNKVIDTDSLMTAFEDYVTLARQGDCGVPINFFLKPITARQLASAWIYRFDPALRDANSTGDDTQDNVRDIAAE